MTPPAATTAGRSHARRPTSTAPRTARRVSGPAAPLRGRDAHVTPRAQGTGATVVAPALGLRLARRAATLPDARVLDRLLRGRLWIGVLGAALVGIVFLQISLLNLNTGISRAVETTQTLERQNTTLKADLSRLAGGERVQDSAAAMGFVSPAAGQPQFLDARTATAARAAANVARPAPVEQLPLGMIAPSEGGTAGLPGAALAATDPAADPAAATAAAATAAAPAPAADPTGAASPVTAAAVAPATTPPAPAPAPAAEPAATASPPAVAAAAPPPTAAAGGTTTTAQG